MRKRIGEALQYGRLRRAAVRYATHGWDVVPGAFLEADRFRCGPGCRTVSCHPYLASWESSACHDPQTVSALWAEAPYSVLLATGRTFDALEVPAYLGASADRGDLRGPVALTPAGRWLLLVRSGATLRPELAGRPDIVLHGRGSWIPAPPTRLPEGRTQWTVAPEEVCWRLPEPWAVQAALVAALPWLGPSHRAAFHLIDAA